MSVEDPALDDLLDLVADAIQDDDPREAFRGLLEAAFLADSDKDTAKIMALFDEALDLLNDDDTDDDED